MVAFSFMEKGADSTISCNETKVDKLASREQTRIQFHFCLTSYSVYFPLLQYHFPETCHQECPLTGISPSIVLFTHLGLTFAVVSPTVCIPVKFPLGKSLRNLFWHPPRGYIANKCSLFLQEMYRICNLSGPSTRGVWMDECTGAWASK